MSEEKFEASARHFTRITRHGLVEENAVTGDIQRISQQPEDTQLGKSKKRRQLRVRRPRGKAQPVKNVPGSALNFSRRSRYTLKRDVAPKLNIESTKKQLRFERPEKQAPAPSDAISSHKAYQQKYRRMRLTQDSLLRTRLRFEYTTNVTGLSVVGESRLSRLKFEHSSGPKLKFNKHGLGASSGNDGPPPTPPGGGLGPQLTAAGKRRVKGFFGGRSALSEEVEKEIDKLAKNSDNEGVQAANQHRKWVSTGMREGGRAGKWWRQGHDGRVDKRAKKAQVRANREKIYQQKHGKPSISGRGRNWFTQRKLQVKRFAEKRLGVKNAQQAEKLLAFAARKVMQVIRLVLTSIGGPVLGIVVVYIGMAAILLMMFGAVVNNAVVVMSSYAADNPTIEAASSYYTKLEAELDKEIKNISTSWRWQHIDSFHYYLDDIEHDPFQLMAYLSVKYPGFTFDQVKTELDYIFHERYTLTLDEWSETRGSPPDEYTYYHLDVTLRAKPMEPILMREMARDTENDLVSWYGVLMETKGAHQAYANPFDIDWSGNVSSLYGYRVDPIGELELQQHRGVDIAMPTGTPIRAGLSGTVRYVGYDSIMGNYIILNTEGAEQTIKYGHCDIIYLNAGDEVVAGETVIGTVGNSGQSTGPHLHLEILENGEYINPIYSLEFRTAEGA